MIKPEPLEQLTPSEISRILKRSQLDIEAVKSPVIKIIENVRKRGDSALIDYTAQFDKVTLNSSQLKVSPEEIRVAYKSTSRDVVEALKKAAKNIERFHRKQLPPEFWLTEVNKGIKLGRIRRPLSSVGLYIPGGRAAYPSTVLMTAIPARIAGVEKIIACTPPMSNGKVNPLTLVAADIAGVTSVYPIGGAQAIAAMAYGTETVPKVDKIVGPGNIYVTAAKNLVYGQVDIDFSAGPSEILILADSTADPTIAAMDLISQAEHDPNAASVIVTTSSSLAKEIGKRLEQLVKKEKRSKIIEQSLNKNGAILIAKNMKEAINFVNEYAPEHLQIIAVNPLTLLKKIKHAGSIFLGPYSPVPAGDYATGANHVLPTGGNARLYAGLSVDNFLKRPTVQMINKSGLKKLQKIILTLSTAEGLPAHSKVVEERLKQKGGVSSGS